jgi:hypothetical protein
MAIAAPLFYGYVVTWVNLLLFIFALLIEVASFGHCLIQRPDAFPAINTLPKGAWLAMIGGSVLVTLLTQSALGILGLVAVTIAAVYLLDVRPALRDAIDGRGSWYWMSAGRHRPTAARTATARRSTAGRRPGGRRCRHRRPSWSRPRTGSSWSAWPPGPAGRSPSSRTGWPAGSPTPARWAARSRASGSSSSSAATGGRPRRRGGGRTLIWPATCGRSPI